MITQLEALLLEQLQSAGSFDAMRRIDIPTAGIEESLAIAMLNLHLVGRAQVWTEVQTEPRQAHAGRAARIVLDKEFQPLPFDEAIAYFRSKVNLSPEEFYALTEAARVKAFTVAVGVEEQIVASIRDLVETALADGLTLREFQDMADDVLDRAGVSAAEPWYWETVYRTNLQTSYQVGRWQQMQDPTVKALRPYLRYISARLPTSRPSHVEKHGLVYPQEHEFWNTWYPPSGFNCFCQVVSVSESLLDRRGWHVSERTQFTYPDPDEGFAVNPGKVEAI